jgi:hypothetical protein
MKFKMMIMAAAAFGLAAGNVQATPLSILLGLPKATADLTPADIDGLSPYQIDHLAAAERYPKPALTTTAANRAWLRKQHAQIQARLLKEQQPKHQQTAVDNRTYAEVMASIDHNLAEMHASNVEGEYDLAVMEAEQAERAAAQAPTYICRGHR